MTTPYNLNEIRRLDAQKHVRLRPAMYFGGVDSRALYVILDDVLEYSIEEAIIGKCDSVSISLHPNGQVAVYTESQGFSTEFFDGENKTHAELLMTQTSRYDAHSGKYIYAGMMGIGMRAVNAISSIMVIDVRRDGYLWRQSYCEGMPQTTFEQVRPLAAGETTGNTFTFTLDFTILEPNEFDYDLLAQRCRELAYTTGLKMVLRDERTDKVREETFYTTRGVIEWVEQLNADKTPRHPIVHERQQFQIDRYEGYNLPLQIEFAFQYTTSPQTTILGYVTTLRVDHGTHVTGFQKGLTKQVQLLSQREAEWDDIASGLTAIISIFHPSPAFESAMRYRIINPELVDHVASVVADVFANTDDAAVRTLFASLPSKKHSSP
jgi:DNA gyrase subunit B